jgi:PST family polysaccharide transporter
LYNRAAQLASVPINQVFGPLTNVVLAGLTRQRGTQNFGVTAQRLATAISVLGVLIFTAMVALADPLVALLLGRQWARAVPVLQVLAVGASFQALTFPWYWIFLGTGRTRGLLRYNVASRLLVIALCGAGLPHGPIGVALGYSLGQALAWPVCMYFNRSALPVGVYWHVAIGTRLLVAGGAAAGAGYLGQRLLNSQPLLELVGGSVAYLAAAGILLVLVGGRRDGVALLRLVRQS